jgi:hypothetical protein
MAHLPFLGDEMVHNHLVTLRVLTEAIRGPFEV